MMKPHQGHHTGSPGEPSHFLGNLLPTHTLHAQHLAYRQRRLLHTLASRYPTPNNPSTYPWDTITIYDPYTTPLERIVADEQLMYELTGYIPHYCTTTTTGLMGEYVTINTPHTDTTTSKMAEWLSHLRAGLTSPPQPRVHQTWIYTVQTDTHIFLPEDSPAPGAIELGGFQPAADITLSPDLTASQQADLRHLFTDFDTTFAKGKFDFGTLDPMVYGYFEIDTGDSPPIAVPRRRFSFYEKEQLQQRVQEYFDSDVVELGSGPWAFSPIFVPKKDGDIRLCIDLRRLNSVTKRNRYTLPRIDDLLAELGGSQYFTALDLKAGYHNALIAPHHREKTAFYTAQGLVQFKRMCFGLSNAPAFFQSVMDKVLVGLLDAKTQQPFAFVYLDDVVIHSATWEEHLQHIRQVLERFAAANLKIVASKCVDVVR